MCIKGTEYAEIGGGFVVLDRWSRSPFPSTNPNRAEFFGVVRPTCRRDLETVVKRFSAAGVGRWFFRLSPCPQAGVLREWLYELGLRPFDGPRYITLVRPAAALPPHRTGLQVRAVPAAELRDHRMFLLELYREYAGIYLATVARDDCTHFLAFDGERPVAAAGLCVTGTTGYLFLGATREADRSRGAQSALIAARITAAYRQGCEIVLAETMSILPTSLANLVRKGFRERYDTEIFVSTTGEDGRDDLQD
jgi:GNAT superfamily N-acetyltransferase